MSKPRAMVCPDCNGTGENTETFCFAIPCACCAGTGHVTAERLRGRANFIECIGDGGYVCGDLDHDDMLQYRVEAAELRRLAEGLETRAALSRKDHRDE